MKGSHFFKISRRVLTLLLCCVLLCSCSKEKVTSETDSGSSVPSNQEKNEKESDSTKKKDESSEEKILRVVDWSDSAKTARGKFNKLFEERHPGVKVEYTCLTVDQFKNTIITMIKSGNGPDLFPIPVGMTLSAALKEDWYQPIDQYITDEFLNTINPECFVEGVNQKDGNLYNFPESYPVQHCFFYYNKTVLDEAGITEIPKTYSEFRDVCKKVTESGKGNYYGLIEGGKQLNRLEVMARSFDFAAGGKLAPAGNGIITVDGEVTYNSPQMLEFMNLISELAEDGSIHPDCVSLGAPEAREMFAQNQAAFLMQGMWCIPTWGETHPELNYGVMSVPVPDNQSEVYGVQSQEIGAWLGIYKNSKYPDLAAEYMMALYSEEYGYQADLVKSGNSVSIVPAINEKYMENEHMKEYYQVAMENTRIIPFATRRDVRVYDVYAEMKDAEPSLGAILQGVIAQSISATECQDYLDQLSKKTLEELTRASEQAGLNVNTFEFPNWDSTKDYTKEDYQNLK